MGVARLAVCVSGIYASFLLWAVAQERLSAPFPSLHPSPHHDKETPYAGDKFPSPLFLNFAQALASCLSALLYLSFRGWRDGTLQKEGLGGVLGFKSKNKPVQANGHELNGSAKKGDKDVAKLPLRSTLPALLLQVSCFQTMAGPIGFMALRHISYPTMVLGKSCKLIPVLLLNVILYRRRFSPHKYLVVALVTVGISLFMLMAETSGKKKGGQNSTWGLGLLGFNLLIDGLTNSTQDQLFALHKSFSGQQMMFTMACTTMLLLTPLLCLPLPTHPLSILSHLPFPLSANPTAAHLQYSPAALPTSLNFLITHPTAVPPLLAYALLGGLGQLFIFETISHFGSLTLVMVTVTRKLFTMLLSVVLFEHKLTFGQWVGVAVVFIGIGVEAGWKRREMLNRAKKD